MVSPPIPVVLVHGWRSHPGIWNRLVPLLEESSVPCWRFSHPGMDGSAPLAEIAAGLQEFLGVMREDTDYTGPVDIVCHSMGTCAARYLLEVRDGQNRAESVRQLIGIGPPNNGSAMAELFNHPIHGPEVIDRLAGVFVPRPYVPAEDAIVQDVRLGSAFMRVLREAGLRDDIAYRTIMAANSRGTEAMFPWFGGKTWEMGRDGEWRMTYAGDGIVANSESLLPGTGCDLLPREPGALDAAPDRYSHLNLPRNPEVLARVMAYLHSPADASSSYRPER
ncbi:MAG: alpha/beta fold hydrolase [Methanomicrobiaceae archaeon]|nr:alpha/beta fold hydrolase [Methanomicrobiaceae archaeon]